MDAPAEVEDEAFPCAEHGQTAASILCGHPDVPLGGDQQPVRGRKADISPEDAARLGIANGEKIRVYSRRGEVHVPARVTGEVPKGMVWMSFHFQEGNSNWLTMDAFDPVTRTAEYKACAVNIEKVT